MWNPQVLAGAQQQLAIPIVRMATSSPVPGTSTASAAGWFAAQGAGQQAAQRDHRHGP